MYKRQGQWHSITEELVEKTIEMDDLIEEEDGDFDPGFECIDGFAADRDLYAAGGESDIWHFDGTDWNQIPVPIEDMQINCICCAADGSIYVAGRFGTLLKITDQKCEVLQQSLTEDDFLDIAAFQGKVYVCTRSALYIIDDKTLIDVDFGDHESPSCCGSLYVNCGQLLSANGHDAHIFDGESWIKLY